MYEFQILKSVDPKTWNNNLKKSKYSIFFQTHEYLMSEVSTPNKFPVFINIVDESKNIKGQLGLVIHKSVKAYSSTLMMKIMNLFSYFGSRALWVGGPIIHEENKTLRIHILKKIIEAIENISNENNLVLISGYTPPQDYLIDDDYKNEFNNQRYHINNFFTYAIDLSSDLDEIWNNIHNSTRRDVKRAQKQNISVKELSSIKELDNYFQLSKTWAKTKGIVSIINPNFKERYWNCIKSGNEKVFLSYQDGELIASHRLGCFNGIAHSHQLTNSYSMATNLGGPILTWHAIEWAKNVGLRIYDFSGGESPPENEKDKKKYSEQWSSLLNYKKKWGGKEYPYYHLIKIKNKNKYKLFRFLSKIDWILRNYKKEQYKRSKKEVNAK